MVIKSREASFGAWSFLIGIILAILLGIFSTGSTNPVLLVALIIIGLVVGYSVTEKDVQTFLFASVATLLASFAGIQGFAASFSLTGITVSGLGIGRIIASILSALLYLFIPATIMVSIKAVFSIAKV